MAETSITRARQLLTSAPTTTSTPWATLGAAALAATAAVLMAGIMVLGPGVRFDDPTAVAASPQP